MISTDTREYRSFELRQKTEGEPDDSMILEGRAVVFNSPEVMFEDEDGTQYMEQVDREAFANAKIDDVILNMNHEGQALARTRNNTLQLELTEDGLDVTADMSKSRASRDAYEAVQNGLLDRLYDGSLVNFPAYEQTSVAARSWYVAQAEAEHRAAEAAKQAAEAARVREAKRTALSEMLNRLEAE